MHSRRNLQDRCFFPRWGCCDEMSVDITSLIVPRADLDGLQRKAMFVLLSSCFDGVTKRQFERDLEEKNWVILIQRRGALVGFSTLLAYETRIANEPVSVIYSGDTLMAPEAWGTTALARTWIAGVNQLRTTYSHGRYYWLLLTSGFRTYRFLPVFWREFFPRFDIAAPLRERILLEQLAHERFGNQFDPATGLVRFVQPQRLRDELGRIPEGRTNDPHVQFFLLRNPGHVRGDELVCLTELSAENLTDAGRRMIAPRRHEACSC
jgi:hypothetical protein